MENISLWTLLLPCVAAILSWLWLLWARLKGWSKGVGEQEPLDPRQSLPADQAPPIPWASALWGRKWSLSLLLLVIAGASYMLFFAPPRLGGEIPITPNQPGRPLFSFHWQRDFLDKYDERIGLAISLVGSSASLLALTWGQGRRARFGGEAALLLAGLTLAGMGQWALAFGVFPLGAGLYGFAVLCFVSWGWMARQRVRGDLEARPRWTPQVEWLLVIAIFLLAAFARFYALHSVPYGVEGDESKWIFEVVEIMVDGRYDSSAEYHRDALPGSFYMQAPFQHWLGIGIYSARLGVVCYSLLGTLAFYWLLRQISPIPLAALGTFLLSISVMDISASRLANVESHVKLWPILALALLAFAIHLRRWEVYGLSGLALALGLLTYDTVLPILLVTFIVAIIELIVNPIDLKSGVTYLAAFLLPPLLTVPILIPYFTGRLDYYKISEKGWHSDGWLTFTNNLSQVARSWFVEARFDFIYHRQGPFINAALLPLLVLGFVLALMTMRSRLSRWVVIWALLVLIPVPILTASPFGRVYYPGVPAVYALIALAGYILMREIARILGSNLAPLGWIVGIAVLAWLPLYNFYLYFNAVSEAGDRQIRREIGEYALSAAEAGAHLFMPYWPNANDPLFVEWQIAELYLRQELSADQVDKAYDQIPIEDFLPRLAEFAHAWERVDILLGKENSSQREQGDVMRETLFRCYPGGMLREGNFFDRYRLEAAVLSEPNCVPVRLSFDSLEADGEEQQLTWTLSSGLVSSLRLTCEQENENILWVEAEKFEWGPGWGENVAFVSDWQGDGYLVDSYGSQAAVHHTYFPHAAPAYAWIRYYKRTVDQAPAYLELEKQVYSFSDVEEDETNQWLWERVGPFDMAAVEQNWRITRPYDDAPERFMALFIDSLVFTTDAEFSPLDDAQREMVYDRVHPLANPTNRGMIELKLAPGRYFCRLGIESAPLVDAYGRSEVWSNNLEVELP
ncbi:MAG: hypothetical protein FJ010_00545 [Chloroflexi bacterium]|nr:hypothetical protein [Chloroflexota bacterium]